MSRLAESLKDHFYGTAVHPYAAFEDIVTELLRSEDVLLDAGCGRTARLLSKFVGRARRLIGIDLVTFTTQNPAIELLQADLGSTGLPTESVDLIMSRSTMEHIADPLAVYTEMHRVLKPNGHAVLLTANLWDYATLVARLVPNRFHPWIVSRTEGRAERDVFPTRFRTNTRRVVERFARRTGFEVLSFNYLGQYPNYFLFNGPLFLLATGYEKLVGRFHCLRYLRGWILVVLRKDTRAPR
jgi:SAM-dependent methyltransferase